jgi:hypothetical protein
MPTTTSRSREDSFHVPLVLVALAAAVAFLIPDGAEKPEEGGRSSSKSSGSGSEVGNGRSADTPVEIRARGWKDVLLRTGEPDCQGQH